MDAARAPAGRGAAPGIIHAATVTAKAAGAPRGRRPPQRKNLDALTSVT